MENKQPELKEVTKIEKFTNEWFDEKLKSLQDEMGKQIDILAQNDPVFMYMKGQFDLLNNQKTLLQEN